MSNGGGRRRSTRINAQTIGGHPPGLFQPSRRLPTNDPAAISYAAYVRSVRRFDRDTLIILAGALSSRHSSAIEGDSVSPYLPWNVAGMAITAICRGTIGGPRPTDRELYELCWNFGNLREATDPGLDDGMRLVARLLHQQVPFQVTYLNEWARAQAIFVDTPFPKNRQPEVMKAGWALELLGCSIADYVSVAFLLNAAATFAEGVYGDEMWSDDLVDFQEVLPLSDFRRIAEMHFVMTVDEAKESRIETQRAIGGPEEFGFNPLISKPFLSGVVPGHWIAPSVHAILRKTSASGVAYLGVDRWGSAFSRDLGYLFQAYVGRQLALVEGASLIPEVRYGRRSSVVDSADWILVLPKYLVIVEVKAASPNEKMRQSVGELHSSHRAKLEKALNQISRTHSAIATERSAFADV